VQAIILAAGEGKRLMPLTADRPKCMIEIAGRPILGHQMDALAKWGVKRSVVVTGSHADVIEKYLEGRSDVRLSYNEKFATTNILASLCVGLSGFEPDGDTFVMASDVIFDESVIGKLHGCRDGDLTICVSKKLCGEEEVKVFAEDGRVLKLGKKLDPAGAYGEFLGVYKASAAAMAEIRAMTHAMIASGDAQAYLFDLLNRLIGAGRVVRALDVGDSLWEEIDFIEDVERARKRLVR
jgi:choline kinase